MRPIVPEDYRNLQRVSSLTGSPDGACACTVWFWQDGWHGRVELLIAGSQPQVVTAGGKVEKDPAFSADGKRLYFLSDGKVFVYDRAADCTSLFFAPEAGFEAHGFAAMPQGVAVKVRDKKITEIIDERKSVDIEQELRDYNPNEPLVNADEFAQEYEEIESSLKR